MPSTLYRRASAAGSPACCSASKLTPLTTQPLRTSRHAISRFDSIVQDRASGREIAQDAKARVAGFFGVELDAENVVRLDRGGKLGAVRAGCDRFGRHGRGERVREIHLARRLDALEQPRRPRCLERVPADVRDLHRRGQPRAHARRWHRARRRPALRRFPRTAIACQGRCRSSGTPCGDALRIAAVHAPASMAVAPKCPTPGNDDARSPAPGPMARAE